ncbi:sensor histidine kinase [Candidatus Methylacidiphilum infernorum]|uniref:histidine kinase n=1 Tax=Methylacidiphilum infernorum (isolate V4) TaxID=481448 RepID=B3DV38_METI4|nr:HAMP domain-containing sensor histidine kinase [Candidatus Methylacidiphilum infernorum]ACD83191.1 Signal transduction histidine kinase [Methylacidiphilum infernorum V4]
MVILRRYPLWIGLFLLWMLLAILSVAFGVCGLIALLWGVSARIAAGKDNLHKGALRIEENLKNGFEQKEAPGSSNLNFIIASSLSSFSGVEGGLWNMEKGYIAYSYPTYEGPLKMDVPSAEKNRIIRLSQQSLKEKRPLFGRFDGTRESLLLYVKPLNLKDNDTVIWTMTRVPIRLVSDYEKLIFFLSSILIFSLLLGIFGLRILQSWSREISRLENIIATTPPDQIPSLPLTGYRELDKLVETLVGARKSLIDEKNRKEELLKKISKNERIVTLGKVAATLTHELRNPLATIQLEVENALQSKDKGNKEPLECVQEQVERMKKLLDSIVLLCHAGEITPQENDLYPWLKSTVKPYEAAAFKHGVDLRVVPWKGSWCFDPQGMSRVLGNLLQNALEHTPKGGWIEVKVEKKDDKLCISVEDSGKGIEDEIREEVFEPFFTKKSHGFGLGLSIVKEIVESHNACIECKAGREGGARFEIELPWRIS